MCVSVDGGKCQVVSVCAHVCVCVCVDGGKCRVVKVCVSVNDVYHGNM